MVVFCGRGFFVCNIKFIIVIINLILNFKDIINDRYENFLLLFIFMEFENRLFNFLNILIIGRICFNFRFFRNF